MAFLKNLEQVQELRHILHNIVDWSLTKRLESIKAALPSFWNNPPPAMSTSDADTRSKASPVASIATQSNRWIRPLTPTVSDPSDEAPVRKRKRLDEMQAQDREV